MACRTTFLDEEARDELLPAHRGVIDALTDVTNENGGRVAGLVGRFGSGKTTIVRHFENESGKRQPRTKYVFVFDAWAHVGDTLRLAFVTELARFLDRNKLINNERRDAVYGAITRQPDRAAAEAVPKAIFPTAVLAVAAVLARLMRGSWELPLEWIVAVGVALFIAALFVGRTRTLTITQKAPDLTSREFQEAFAKAVSAALRPNDQRKLVIVFDDLDRLTPDEADEVVTVLRIFFDSCREIPEFNRLWFVVPFDREAMTNNLEKRGSDALQKLFAIEIEVPPPNLPAGSEVFEKRFLKAFAGHTRLEAQRVNTMLLQKEPNPTLRSVTAFINRLAVLHIRWCHRGIPIADLAAYVLVANGIDPAKIASLPRPAGASDEWHSHVGALYFNVDPSEAQYLIRGKAIETAILNGASEALWQLSETPGFTETVSRILAGKADHLATTPQQLVKVAAAFGTNDYAELIWDRLVHIAREVKSWPTDIDLRPLAVILGHANAEDRRLIAAAVFGSLSNGLQQTRESDSESFDRWLANFVALRDTLGSDLPVQARDTIAGSPLFRLQVLGAIESGKFEPPATPPVMIAEGDPMFLLDFAANRLKSNTYRPIAHFVSLLRNVDWTTAFDAGEQKIYYASAIQPGHPAMNRIMELFGMVERHAQRPEATERLDVYSQRGDFLQFAIFTWHLDAETPAVMLALLTMRRLDVIGHIVRVVSVDAALQKNAHALLEFLHNPEQNPARLETIYAVHERLGVTGDSRDLLVAAARLFDEKGGIELAEIPR